MRSSGTHACPARGRSGWESCGPRCPWGKPFTSSTQSPSPPGRLCAEQPTSAEAAGFAQPQLGAVGGGGSKLLGPDLHSGVGPESRFLIQPAGEGWPLRPTAGEDVPLEITDGDGDRSVLLCRERRGGAGLPRAQPGGSRAAGKGGAWRQQQQQAPAGTDVLQPVPTQRGIKERGATKSPKKCLSGISQLRLRRITGRTEA